MTDKLSIEGMTAAVRAKWAEAVEHHPSGTIWTNENSATHGITDDYLGDHWRDAFSRLTPSGKSLAVACPKCEQNLGYECHPCVGDSPDIDGNLDTPHPERIALVQELEFAHLPEQPEESMESRAKSMFGGEITHQAAEGIEDLLFTDKTMLPSRLIPNEANRDDINRRITEAHSRGRLAGLEEAAKVCEAESELAAMRAQLAQQKLNEDLKMNEWERLYGLLKSENIELREAVKELVLLIKTPHIFTSTETFKSVTAKTLSLPCVVKVMGE